MIVAATEDGVHDLERGDVVLAGHEVRFFAAGPGESWALVDHGRAVLRADGGGAWHEVAAVEGDAGLVIEPLGPGRAVVGTEAAHLLVLNDGGVRRLASFDSVPGREGWKNPAAAGRPDVWSLALDGDAIFASVHVGGLWRSRDGGDTWENVLEPDVDIHQVTSVAGMLGVAAEGGFATSRDRGNTWAWTTDGLHAAYLQSVAFADDTTVFVGASSGPFGSDAAVYRAETAGSRFERRSAGLPDSFAPIPPQHLAADGTTVAVAAWNSREVLGSHDGGDSWTVLARDLPRIRSLAVA